MKKPQTSYSEPEQRSPEWFNQRKGRITASAVGAIMGLAPYQTRKDVMRRMVREYHGLESEFKGNAATEWGTMNEAGAIKQFEMETGLTVSPAPFIEYGMRYGASPDGFVSDGSLIEVKCPYGLRNVGEFKLIEDQMHYYAQVQFQLFCTKNERGAYFYQWSPFSSCIEFVERNDDYIVEMMQECEKFYSEYLTEREMPNAKKYLDIEPSNELDDMMNQYQFYKAERERIDEKMKELLDGMVTLTDGVGGTIAGHKLFKTEKQGAISYAKAIKELLPNADLEPYRGKPSEYWSVK